MGQAIFRISGEEHSLEAVLVVEYMNSEGETFEKELPFSCGEDLQAHMKDIFAENWNELFESYERKNGISCCTIKGIDITGKNDKGSLSVHISDGYAQGTSIINDEVIKDENAQKIKEILEIAKR